MEKQDSTNSENKDLRVYAKDKAPEAYEIIKDENLLEEEAKRYMTTSLKREYASENGTELNVVLPKMSPLNLECLKKNRVHSKKLPSLLRNIRVWGGIYERKNGHCPSVSISVKTDPKIQKVYGAQRSLRNRSGLRFDDLFSKIRTLMV